MFSVQNGCCQKCSAGWPPPITFPFMSETLTSHPFLSLLFIITSPYISSSLSFLFFWTICPEIKRENDKSLPVIPSRKTLFWMALPQGMCHQLVLSSCALRLPHAQWTWNGFNALHFMGLNLAEFSGPLRRIKALYCVEELSLQEKYLMPSLVRWYLPLSKRKVLLSLIDTQFNGTRLHKA